MSPQFDERVVFIPLRVEIAACRENQFCKDGVVNLTRTGGLLPFNGATSVSAQALEADNTGQKNKYRPRYEDDHVRLKPIRVIEIFPGDSKPSLNRPTEHIQAKTPVALLERPPKVPMMA
jgi:hypothetical protein